MSDDPYKAPLVEVESGDSLGCATLLTVPIAIMAGVTTAVIVMVVTGFFERAPWGHFIKPGGFTVWIIAVATGITAAVGLMRLINRTIHQTEDEQIQDRDEDSDE